MEAEAKAQGKRPQRAKIAEIPGELYYLLGWYEGCRRGQERNQEVEPLSNKEILAYRELHHLSDVMTSFDVDILYQIDRVWFESLPKAPKPSPPPPARGRVGRR